MSNTPEISKVLADNLKTLDENQPKIFEAGRLTGISEIPYVEAVAEGKSVVKLDDVSEAPHTISLKLSGDMKDITSAGYGHGEAKYKVVFTPEYMQTANYEQFIQCHNSAESAWVNGNIDLVVYGDEAYEDGSGGYYFYECPKKTFITDGVWEISVEYSNDRQNKNLLWQNAEGNFTVYKVLSEPAEKTVNVLFPVFDEIVFDENNDFQTLSSMNLMSKNDDGTYSLTPNKNGKVYGIASNLSGVSLNIGNVLHCSIESISKIGQDYGWRVQYEDGSYNSVSRSLSSDITIDKPIKKLLLYCDMGTADFSYESVIFSGVRVVKEQEATQSYIADANGEVDGIKSISPNMTFMCDEMNISVSYHKSYGMQTEYDRFWDAFQQNGNRKYWTYAFYSGNGEKYWNDENYNPIYPIKAIASNGMFQNSYITDTKVPIDLTQGTGSTAGTTFAYGRLKNIRKLIVNEDTAMHQQFTGCTALENIIIEGVVARKVDLSPCPLSRKSIENLISVLSPTTSDLTVSLKKTAVDKAFETKAGAADGSASNAWLSLIAQKSNWTISLV